MPQNDPFGSIPEDSTVDLTAKQEKRKDKLFSLLTKNLEGIDFFGSEGLGKGNRERRATNRAENLRKKLSNKFGVQFDEFGNPLDEGFTAPRDFDFAEGVDSRAVSDLAGVGRKRNPDGPDAGPRRRARLRGDVIEETDIQRDEEARDFFETNIEPLAGRIRDEIAQLIDQPLFDADTQAAIRSSTISNARSQEAQRLNRVSALLGMRGLDPSSPAGASLVNRVAEDADARLQTGLRDLDLRFREGNRQFMRENLALGQQSLASDVGLRQLALDPSADRLRDTQFELMAVDTTLGQMRHQRRLAEHLMLEARSEQRGGGSGAYDDIGQVANIAGIFARGHPSLGGI